MIASLTRRACYLPFDLQSERHIVEALFDYLALHSADAGKSPGENGAKAGGASTSGRATPANAAAATAGGTAGDDADLPKVEKLEIWVIDKGLRWTRGDSKGGGKPKDGAGKRRSTLFGNAVRGRRPSSKPNRIAGAANIPSSTLAGALLTSRVRPGCSRAPHLYLTTRADRSRSSYETR